MKLIRILVLATFCVSWTQANAQKNIPALEREAHNVTIIRDNWGVPHVYGKTDADAVFGVKIGRAHV